MFFLARLLAKKRAMQAKKKAIAAAKARARAIAARKKAIAAAKARARKIAAQKRAAAAAAARARKIAAQRKAAAAAAARARKIAAQKKAAAAAAARARKIAAKKKAAAAARARAAAARKKAAAAARARAAAAKRKAAAAARARAAAAKKKAAAAAAARARAAAAARKSGLRADRTYLIENVVTGRYVFDAANKVVTKRGAEGGWIGKYVKPALGVDANYYNKAVFRLVRRKNGTYFIEGAKSNRYLFDAGVKLNLKKKRRGAEGGWVGKTMKPAVTADANYYNRAIWVLENKGKGNYFIRNQETNRYLFLGGSKVTKRGREGGWVAKTVPSVLTTDANYYNRALFRFVNFGSIKAKL